MRSNASLYKILIIIFLVLTLIGGYLYYRLSPQFVAIGNGWIIQSEIKSANIKLQDKTEFTKFINEYIKIHKINEVNIDTPTKNSVTNKIDSVNIIFTDQIQGEAKLFDADIQTLLLADRSSFIKRNKLVIKIYLAPELLVKSDENTKKMNVVILQSIYKVLKPIKPDTKAIYRSDMNSIYSTNISKDRYPIFIIK